MKKSINPGSYKIGFWQKKKPRWVPRESVGCIYKHMLYASRAKVMAKFGKYFVLQHGNVLPFVVTTHELRKDWEAIPTKVR